MSQATSDKDDPLHQYPAGPADDGKVYGHVVLDARVHEAARPLDSAPLTVQILLRRRGQFIYAVVDAKSRDDPNLDVALHVRELSLVRVSGCITIDNSGMHRDAQKLTLYVSRITVLSLANPRTDVEVAAERCHLSLHGALGEQVEPGDWPLDERLDDRLLDARVAATAAIFKTFSGAHQLAVEFLASRDFYHVPTPTLIHYMYPGEESDHFAVPYFDKTAWLAPTGEVHLGMALAADMERVYDIHSVFRREEVVDNRHLTEFTMLELVLSIQKGWHELLDMAEDLLIFLIKSLQQRIKHALQLQTARHLYPLAGIFELGLIEGRLIRVTFIEAKKILSSKLGMLTSFAEDFTAGEESALGRFIASDASHLGPRSDIFAITNYPRHLRPCNLYPSEDGTSTNSFDIIMRGQEIVTGCQLVHTHHELLSAFASRAHPIDPDSPGWRPFVRAHEIGMPPWGGFGMGLNRFVQSFLGLSDIRETVLFPRNASRLVP